MQAAWLEKRRISNRTVPLTRQQASITSLTRVITLVIDYIVARYWARNSHTLCVGFRCYSV